MTASLTLLLFSLLSPEFDSRTAYQPGYVIDNDGVRSEVFIYDGDWKNNPTRFRYRTSAYGDSRVGGVDDIQEFGYDNQTLRYRRYRVDMDHPETGPSDQPENVVFLEWLVDGDTDLFSYEGEGDRRYFYRHGEDAPQPLTDRKSWKQDEMAARETLSERIRQDVNCMSDQRAIEALEFTTEALVRYFEAHNSCVGAQTMTTIRKNRRKVHFAIGPRVGYGGYHGDFINQGGDIKFRPIQALRYGLEVEAGLPFAQRHLAVFAEVGYISLSSKARLPEEESVYMDYEAIYVPVGVRYLLPLAGNITAQAMLGVEGKFPSNSIVERYTGDADLQNVSTYEVSRTFAAFGGIGLTFADRVVFDIRYAPNQDYLSDVPNATTEIDALTISIGYQVNL
jgi:hypothetical protein